MICTKSNISYNEHKCKNCDEECHSDENCLSWLWLCLKCCCCMLFYMPIYLPVRALFKSCKQCYNECGFCCCCCYCCTCYKRPGNLACGLVTRILLREMPGLIATVLVIMLWEDMIIDICVHPAVRALAITGTIVAIQAIGYLFGALFGRWFEACCEHISWNTTTYYRIRQVNV